MARWTRRVFPSVHRWIGRLPGDPITYRLAQSLSGHGAYNGYLHRFGIAASPNCAHCGAPMDDAEHTLFICKHWEDMRTELAVVLGHQVQSNDVEKLFCGEGGT